jgi:hypothetical protein
MRFQKRFVRIWIVLLSMCLTACGADKALTLVASYPKSSSGGSALSAAAGGPVVVETVYLTLEMDNPEGAADSAARLVHGYGGYEADQYAWDSDDGRTVSQELFVPLGQAENLRLRLLQMGRTVRDSVVRDSTYGYLPGDGWAQFSIQYLPLRHTVEWDHSFDDWDHAYREDFLSKICAFFQQAAAVGLQWLAAFLLAAAVVIPCAWMGIGAVASIRWLFRR